MQHRQEADRVDNLETRQHQRQRARAPLQPVVAEDDEEKRRSVAWRLGAAGGWLTMTSG